MEEALAGAGAVPTGTLMVRVVRRMTLPVAGSRSSVTSVCCWVPGVAAGAGAVVVVLEVVVVVVAGLVWAAAARGRASRKAARKREWFMMLKGLIRL